MGGDNSSRVIVDRQRALLNDLANANEETLLGLVSALEMRKHPDAGYRIVTRIGFLKEAAEIVHSHHERYDGKGYSRGLKSEDISFGARMFMVADVYDALTSESGLWSRRRSESTR